MERPALIYDADCGICTAAVNWVQHTLVVQPKIVASRDIRAADYRLTEQNLTERAWLHTVSGNLGGHEAAAGVLIVQPEWHWRLLGHLLLTPPYSWLARLGYAIVARNRHRIRIGPQQCEMPQR